MMEQQDKKNKSPFYVEYPGLIKDNLTVRTTSSFKDALAKHLQDKYPNEINKKGEHNFSKCLRFILEDYLQNQCLEQRMFEYTLFGLIDLSKLPKIIDGDIRSDSLIACAFVKDSYSEFLKDTAQFNRYQAHKTKLSDYNVESQMFTIRELKLFNGSMESYISNHDAENVYVIEVALNNFLDSYDDGVYGLKADKSKHLSANFISTADGVYGLIIIWFFDADLQMHISNIEVVSSDALLHELYLYNRDKFNLYENIFAKHQYYFPNNTVKLMEKEIARNKKRIKELKVINERLESDIEDLKS